MNPWSNHQIGQAQHREYEAKYGNSYDGEGSQKEGHSPLSQHKMALALSSASLTAWIFFLARLF